MDAKHERPAIKKRNKWWFLFAIAALCQSLICGAILIATFDELRHRADPNQHDWSTRLANDLGNNTTVLMVVGLLLCTLLIVGALLRESGRLARWPFVCYVILLLLSSATYFAFAFRLWNEEVIFSTRNSFYFVDTDIFWQATLKTVFLGLLGIILLIAFGINRAKSTKSSCHQTV